MPVYSWTTLKWYYNFYNILSVYRHNPIFLARQTEEINETIIPQSRWVRLNSDINDRCTHRSWPWARVRPLLILCPTSIEGYPIYYGPKSNAFIREAFQRDDQVEWEKGWGEMLREKKVRLWKGKKKQEGSKRRTKRWDADGWRATIESCFSTTKATRRATRSPSARQGVARRLDHYRHCPLMDIYECTNQRHHYRASMQSESII